VRRLHVLRALLLAAAVLGAAAVAALGFEVQGGGPPCPQVAAASAPVTRRPLPIFSRVVVIVMENRECGEVIGTHAPYVTSLARSSLLALDWYAIRHPSLPNYLALTGGSTFGIRSDCTGCDVSQPSLVDQLERAGIGWRAYMEGLPAPCFTKARAGQYRKKHDPFVYYTDVAGSAERCRNVVPLTQLAADLARHELPRFTWITPDLCHDMHDCSTETGDRFLSTLVPPVLRALGPRGVLFLTWDEGRSGRGCCTKSKGGNVAAIVAGPLVRPGTVTRIPLDHYSLLKTIEQSWHLPELGEAACRCTRSLAGLLR